MNIIMTHPLVNAGVLSLLCMCKPLHVFIVIYMAEGQFVACGENYEYHYEVDPQPLVNAGSAA